VAAPKGETGKIISSAERYSTSFSPTFGTVHIKLKPSQCEWPGKLILIELKPTISGMHLIDA